MGSLLPLSTTQCYMDPVFSDLDFSVLPEVNFSVQDDYLMTHIVQPLLFLSPNPKITAGLPVQWPTLPLSPAIPIKALSSDRIEPLPALSINPEIVRVVPAISLGASSKIPRKAKKRKTDIIDLTNRPYKSLADQHIIDYIKEGIDSRWAPYFGKKTDVLYTNFKQWNSEKNYTVINGYFQPTLKSFCSTFITALPNLRTFTDLKQKTFIVQLPAQKECREYFEMNAKNISIIKPRQYNLINQFMKYAIKENLEIFDREIQIKKVYALFITFAKKMHYARLKPDIFHSQFSSHFKCMPILKNQELFYHMPSIAAWKKIMGIKRKKIVK